MTPWSPMPPVRTMYAGPSFAPNVFTCFCDKQDVRNNKEQIGRDCTVHNFAALSWIVRGYPVRAEAMSRFSFYCIHFRDP